jgi:phage shock protein PspC (stress-responsive transcriptional regulator)
MFKLHHRKQNSKQYIMNPIQSIKGFFEKQAFGVCAWLGTLLKMRSSNIRLFFIYTSFLTVGSPIIIYMILAFWLKMKNYVFSKRTSVWD